MFYNTSVLDKAEKHTKPNCNRSRAVLKEKISADVSVPALGITQAHLRDLRNDLKHINVW